MEYAETFEALQRGTVDCTLGQLVPSAEGGIFEVAPHVGYMTETSISRSPGALLAGSGFEQLPLGYQQVIFDSYADYYHGQMQTTVGGNAAAVGQAKDANGEILAFDDALQDQVADYSEELTAAALENGLIDEDILATITASEEEWTTRFEELGYTDEGTVADFDEWYDTETDFSGYAKSVYEDGTAQQHRPS